MGGLNGVSHQNPQLTECDGSAKARHPRSTTSGGRAGLSKSTLRRFLTLWHRSRCVQSASVGKSQPGGSLTNRWAQNMSPATTSLDPIISPYNPHATTLVSISSCNSETVLRWSAQPKATVQLNLPWVCRRKLGQVQLRRIT